VSITFWFDPSCPFTWRTSRWIRDVAERKGEPVRWQFLSLSMLNEGNDEIPERYRQEHARARKVLRVLAGVDQRHGQEAVGRLYTAIGTRVHDQDAELGSEALTAALADAGLPADLVELMDDPEMDKLIRESHDASQARVGTDSGSPVTAIGDGPAFFGPVVVPIPRAEDADRLFEALSLLAQVPQFSEFKRARNPL
jgi:2-hydroxychromene-2-carboxylate isomerase